MSASFKVYGIEIREREDGKWQVTSGSAKGIYESAQSAEDMVEFYFERSQEACR